MSTAIVEGAFSFTLPPENEAHEPPELRGLRRDGVRLLVSRGDEAPLDSHFSELGSFLVAGDALVVNTSATINAALPAGLPDGSPALLHYSGCLPGGIVLVEPRRPRAGSSVPLELSGALVVTLPAGASARLLAPYGGSRRLWLATLHLGEELLSYTASHGRPIAYRHAPGPFPLSDYQTVFSREPGSAEMPSAARPFTDELVTELVGRGIAIVPLLLHAGVSSLEGGELPYPEHYRVSPAAAAALNAIHHRGGRAVAVGTTVVRALATVTDEAGLVHAGEGESEAVVGPASPVPSVDGLITGWHEPESSHLALLSSLASRGSLERGYGHALGAGYRWHEFGDSHLLLPGAAA